MEKFSLGRSEHLLPLLHASIELGDAAYLSNIAAVSLELINHSDARFELLNLSDTNFMNAANSIFLEPHGKKELRLKPESIKNLEHLTFRVLNAQTAPGENPNIQLKINRKQEQ